MSKREKLRRSTRHVASPTAAAASVPTVTESPSAVAMEPSGIKPAAPQCGRCNSVDVRRSRLHSIVEHAVVAALPVSPYRCRYCGARFWRVQKTAGSALRAALVLSLLAVVFFVSAGFAGW